MNKSKGSYRANGSDPLNPAPNASNSQRKGGGNDDSPGDEKLGQKKAEKVSVTSRFSSNPPGPMQPGRDGGGNSPVSQVVEGHNQSKAERVRPSQRF